MKLKDLSTFLDEAVPVAFQESYDNSGLQLGLPGSEIHAALLTLDITEAVIDEAIKTGCDVIISHHPLIFSGLKNITGKTLTEKLVMKLIKADIAVYSAHTNLDVIGKGVSRKMAEKLNFKDISVLSPLKNRLLKLVTFVPKSHLRKVRDAIFEAGAGSVGNYDNCSFTAEGTGSFRGNENANPYKGGKGEIHFENEVRFETVLYTHQKNSVLKAMKSVHPYEEVAYDLYPLENDNTEIGYGCYGDLFHPMAKEGFLKLVSEVFSSGGIKYAGGKPGKIKKVAVCGGSGGSLLVTAIASGADAFITSDIKYHSYFEAEDKILLVDIGHYESEKFSVEILYDLIIKKFPTFALRFSKIKTNPIKYLKDGKS